MTIGELWQMFKVTGMQYSDLIVLQCVNSEKCPTVPRKICNYVHLEVFIKPKLLKVYLPLYNLFSLTLCPVVSTTSVLSRNCSGVV